MIIVRVENCIFDRKTSGTFISDFFFNFQIENATQRENAKNATKLDTPRLNWPNSRYAMSNCLKTFWREKYVHETHKYELIDHWSNWDKLARAVVEGVVPTWYSLRFDEGFQGTSHPSTQCRCRDALKSSNTRETCQKHLSRTRPVAKDSLRCPAYLQCPASTRQSFRFKVTVVL